MTTQAAHDVVANYLRRRAEKDEPTRQRDHIALKTREIVDELPDGFTVRDVKICVETLIDGDVLVRDMNDGRRRRAMHKALAEMVADDDLKLEGKLYFHRPIA